MAPPEEAPETKDPCRSTSFQSKEYTSVFKLATAPRLATFERYLTVELLLQLIPFFESVRFHNIAILYLQLDDCEPSTQKKDAVPNEVPWGKTVVVDQLVWSCESVRNRVRFQPSL